MGDYIVRATAADHQIRAFAITSREMVEQARSIHNTSPVATAALGRLLTAGAMMGSILFARLDVKEVLEKVEAKKAADAAEQDQPEEAKEEAADVIDIEPKAEITFDDFAKLQFQVGEIIACEAVKKSKKLLCSQVRIGSQVKQIVSGIKSHYTPEEMVGKKVMVVVNLKPAKLAGILSEGMLLCAEDAEGNLALMTPEKDMPAGAEIC